MTTPTPTHAAEDHNATPEQSAKPPVGLAAHISHAPEVVQHRREVFWQNITREILNGLAAAASASRPATGATGAATGPAPTAELFDGRLAVITSLGQRIAIADIYPVFACSIANSAVARDLSTDVQCTVYQIRTPNGEMHTLPIHEIRQIHALSPELMAKLAAAAESASGDKSKPEQPFGFAAFTSLARGEESDES